MATGPVLQQGIAKAEADLQAYQAQKEQALVDMESQRAALEEKIAALEAELAALGPAGDDERIAELSAQLEVLNAGKNELSTQLH